MDSSSKNVDSHHSSAKPKEDQRRKVKCINRGCRNRDDLVDAESLACSYYKVDCKPGKQVCMACLKKCREHYKCLEMKWKEGKCIMESTFPCFDSSGEEDEKEEEDEENQKPSTSKFSLPNDQEVKKAIEDAVENFFDKNKNLIQHQVKLCDEYIAKETQELKTAADDLDNFILDFEREIESLRNEL